MTWVRWIFTALCAIALALFAVANGSIVTISFDPLPYDIDVPLYLAVIMAGLAGVLIGAAGAWWAGRTDRRALRAARRDITRMSREMTDGLPNTGLPNTVAPAASLPPPSV